MKIKKCPRCGATLIEETYERKNGSSSSETEILHSSPLEPSGCREGSSNYEGSIDVYSPPNIGYELKVYRCPNPKCGYLSTDC